MLLVGDIHGKLYQLKNILHSTDEEVFVLGDIGIGFKGVGSRPFFRNNMKFIRGNHDKPSDCREHPQYLGDYGYIPEKKMFFISGAISVDIYRRTEGVDWWPDEQLSYSDLMNAIELYKETKPEIVISHDCPWEITEELCDTVVRKNPYLSKYGTPRKYSTNIAFDTMLEFHRPKRWFFGHWHISYEKESNSTLFKCLNELETIQI